jgi:tetratricopeptide (TPR) repeat protein
LSWLASLLADDGAELRAWLIAHSPDFLQESMASAPIWVIGIVAALAAVAVVWVALKLAGGILRLAGLGTRSSEAEDAYAPAPPVTRRAVRSFARGGARGSKLLAQVMAYFDRLDVDRILAGTAPLGPAERELRNAAVAEIVAEASPAANAAAREIAAGDIARALAILERDARAADEDAAERWRRLGALVLSFDPAKALAAYEEAFRLQPDDFWTCIELTRQRSVAGDLRGAHQAAFAAERAAQSERETAVALNALGNVLVKAGDPAGAKARYEASLQISEDLAAENWRSPTAQRDLSTGFIKLGDVLVQLGDLGAAKARYEASLKIRERLAAQNKRSDEAQRDLALSLTKLGSVAEKAGDLAGAKARYEASLQIAERLAAESKGSARAQRELSISLDNLGYVLLRAGDDAGARARYEASRRISERWPKNDDRGKAAIRG